MSRSVTPVALFRAAFAKGSRVVFIMGNRLNLQPIFG